MFKRLDRFFTYTGYVLSASSSRELKPVNIFLRLTAPFAIILMLLMFLFLPFWFMIIGRWSYTLSSRNIIHRWFEALRLYKTIKI
jgi:hypothetical protein